MVSVTFSKAKEWLNNISSRDAVAIIHDVDADGTCAAIIAYEHCEKKGARVKHFGYFRGDTTLSSLDLSHFNKIILLDLASSMFFHEKKIFIGKEVLYVDHHTGAKSQFDEEVLEYRTASGICTSRSMFELTGLKEWLAIIGAFSDAGEKYPENNEWFEKFAKNLRIPLKKFKEDYVWHYGNLLIYFGKGYDKAFEVMRKFKKFEDIRMCEHYWGPVKREIDEIIQRFDKERGRLGPANYFYFEPHFDIKSPVINAISFKDEKEIFIFANPKSENRIGISTRSQSDRYNMAEMLKKSVEGFENASGGGHPRAAGCTLKREDFGEFKKRVVHYFNTH